MPTQRVEATMTTRQIELEFMFLQREWMRNMKAHRRATLSAIGEALGGKG
jgi:hypothetical protein